MTTVLFYWNELTPYRLHLMRRLATEVPDIRIVHVFSHSVSRNTMPWQMTVPDNLELVHFPDAAMPYGSPLHPRAWRLSRLVAQTMDRVQPDMLVLHGHGDASRWLVAMAARTRKIPLLHASDANALEDPLQPGMSSLPLFAFLKVMLALTDGYMPMGLGGRIYYGRYGGRGKPMFYFPYEPDSRVGDFMRSDCQRFARRFGLDPSRSHFLYSGRLVPEKRVDAILGAFARIAAERPDWNLVVAGAGPLEGRLKAMVPESMRGRVHFLGFLQIEDLAAAYHFCDVLVHASSYEPWGLVIHEAVTAGMAVVASDTSGAAVELVRHKVNGLRCRPDSLESLTAAMREASSAERLIQMKARAPDVLEDWRQGYDPVQGFREAVAHFCTGALAR